MLAAHSPEILRELAALGTSMQAAQDALDAADLRRLAQQRRQLLASTVKAAQALAARHGRAISAAVATEVEQTLRAATADPGGRRRRAKRLSAPGALGGRGRRRRSRRRSGCPGEPCGAVPGTGAAPGTASVRGTEPATAAGGTEPADRTAQRGGTAGGKPTTEQPRLRAVGTARMTPTPSAVERARTALEAAEVAAAEADEEAGRAAAELAEATAETSRLADEVRELRRRLDAAEAGLKTARKRSRAGVGSGAADGTGRRPAAPQGSPGAGTGAAARQHAGGVKS